MQYQGGKSRISKKIASVITDEVSRRQIQNSENDSFGYRAHDGRGGDCFVSLFCGSCAVESKITGFRCMILNDKHEYLIALLRGVQSGYVLPDAISVEQYQYIREHKELDPILTGFTGFGCSFGGKWFGGYARNKTGTNYAAEGKRSLLKDMATLKDAAFVCGDYRQLPIPTGAVVYADPPYKNTTGYNGEKFDTDMFWVCMRLLAQTGHLVFISEQEAPDDFVCIWQQSFTRTLDRNKENQFKVTEKLFTYKEVMQGVR